VSVQVLAMPLASVRPQRDAVAHSSTFTHVADAPLPEAMKPGPQVHEKLPATLVQVFTPPPPTARPHCDAVAHSFTSTHVAVRPLPCAMKPAPHAHV